MAISALSFAPPGPGGVAVRRRRFPSSRSRTVAPAGGFLFCVDDSAKKKKEFRRDHAW
jgi:hypothetical protein